MIDTVTASAKPIGATAVFVPAVLALLLGALLVYGVGFRKSDGHSQRGP